MVRESYHQSFSSVAADRNSEKLSRLQTVPSRAGGLGAQWAGSLGSAQRFVVGGDYREVKGNSEDTIFTPGGTTLADAGGLQRSSGIFAQDIVRLGRDATLTLGARYDRTENLDAARTTDGATTPFPNRSENSFSPKLSFLTRLGGRLSLTASAYKAFRTPTLNELYRTFRVGSTLTLANEDLAAERMKGAETGLLYTTEGGLLVRGNVFWMGVDDPVANVTLSTTPSLITRQRRNLGSLRSRGIELEAEARIGKAWTLGGGYLFADSTVRSYPADPLLEGLRVPQVPRHQLTFEARFTSRQAGTVGVQARWSTDAYEDDLNTMRLGAYTIVDALWSHAIAGDTLAVFVAGENILDENYDIGLTPTHLVGAPRTWRGGLRLSLGG
jgi:outer membrane receptor protein involved in Fe transport